MNDSEMHEHIRAAASSRAADAVRLTTRMMRTCWPGGSQDHLDRTALEWLRYWRPERCVTALPACSCADGRCAVCN